MNSNHPDGEKPSVNEKRQQTCSLLGAHFSIAGGLHQALYEAVSYRCNTLQIFTKNANTWKERYLSQSDIDRFEKAKSETGLTQIASHTSYLINLATDEKKKHFLSYNALKQELIRSSTLGIPYVVLHPGFSMGSGEASGIRRIADNINAIFAEISYSNTRLLLETTAGQGSSLGHTFEQIRSMMDKIENKKRIGACLDTCHIFAAGYDIRTEASYKKTIREFDSMIGLTNLYLIHLNDAKKDLGTRVDRHEHIGLGLIGVDAFKYFMSDKLFIHIPKIIETPKFMEGKDMDNINLKRLRGLTN